MGAMFTLIRCISTFAVLMHLLLGCCFTHGSCAEVEPKQRTGCGCGNHPPADEPSDEHSHSACEHFQHDVLLSNSQASSFWNVLTKATPAVAISPIMESLAPEKPFNTDPWREVKTAFALRFCENRSTLSIFLL